jgi:hypothetical protein
MIRESGNMKEIFRSKGKQKLNVWKIVAAVFIILFCAALIGGLFRISQPRPPFMAPTQEQIDSAKAVVAQDLEKRGDDINNYEVIVSDRIGEFKNIGIGVSPKPSGRQGQVGMHEGKIIHVSLYSNSTNHFYLIDMDSEKVVMHSLTEWTE